MPLRSADRLNSPYSTIASSISEPCAHEATCLQYWPHECSRPEPDTETSTLVGGHHPVRGPLRLGRAMVGRLLLILLLWPGAVLGLANGLPSRRKRPHA